MAFGQLDRGHTDQPISEINVTPLVDVMLVLVIILIVTAPLLSHQIKLNLPKAKTEASTVTRPLVISLTRDSQIYLDAQPIAAPELRARLERAVAAGEQPTVELRADGELAYQQVVQVMALVQSAGITKLAFLTEPSTVPAP
ncbi:MAG: biopolymer transporter ExbD [Nitrospiria bacterium]